MSRKSSWLPGNPEPGRNRDSQVWSGFGQSKQPLGDVLIGVFGSIVGIAFATYGVVIWPSLNVPAGLIIFLGAAALTFSGVFAIVRGARRWRWRRRNVAATGGRYLRSWESSDSKDRPR